MEAIILAAGKGTRMDGLCDLVPKPLLPLANQPVLDYIIHGLAHAGIEKAFLVLGHKAELIREYLEKSALPIPVEILIQETPNGTGSAALLGKDRMKHEPFLLLYADIAVRAANFQRMIDRHNQDDADCVLSTRCVPDPWRGAAVYVEHDRVVRIIEKPPKGSSTTNLDNAGIYIFPPEIFALLTHIPKSPRGEYELTDGVDALLEQGSRIRPCEMQGYWVNLTDQNDLLEANRHRLAEAGATPRLCTAPPDPTVIIDPTAEVLSRDIGPNVSVGPNCRVAENCVVSDAILMQDCVLKAGARVEHAVLAPGEEKKEHGLTRTDTD